MISQLSFYSQMSDLKKKIADGQSEMKQLADREQQAKAMEEAQKKAAEEEAQKQQQASNQKQQVQQTSTKTVDNSEAATSANNVSGSKTLTMSATAYSTEANGMGTYSATGTRNVVCVCFCVYRDFLAVNNKCMFFRSEFRITRL